MQPTFDDVAGLLREAASQGYIVLVPPGQPAGTVTLDRWPMAPPLRSNAKSPGVALRLLFNLTNAESQVLVALEKPDPATFEELRAAIPSTGGSAKLSKSDVVGVVIYRLRKKLKPYDITIANVHGLGFRLDKDNRDKLRKVLAAADNAEKAKTEAA